MSLTVTLRPWAIGARAAGELCHVWTGATGAGVRAHALIPAWAMRRGDYEPARWQAARTHTLPEGRPADAVDDLDAPISLTSTALLVTMPDGTPARLWTGTTRRGEAISAIVVLLAIGDADEARSARAAIEDGDADPPVCALDSPPPEPEPTPEG